jgi:hypothetical protein
MRAYWSAASAMTGRASFAELAKNLWPPGHLPPSGVGRAGRPDPCCSVAMCQSRHLAFQACLVDVAPLAVSHLAPRPFRWRGPGASGERIKLYRRRYNQPVAA